MEDPATRNIIVASQLHRDHIEIVKYFEFSSALMRMSVIARRGDEYWVFSKGSPEVIKSLASHDTSTIQLSPPKVKN
jgi:magnesium-transporting ATPase (P-type)